MKLRNYQPDPNWFEVSTNLCSDLKGLRIKPSMYNFLLEIFEDLGAL